jgi:hypothetical protein
MMPGVSLPLREQVALGVDPQSVAEAAGSGSEAVASELLTADGRECDR